MNENQVGTVVIEAAIEAHRHLGPGLLESVYETVLAYELTARGLLIGRQVPIPVRYKNLQLMKDFARI
jgi:GxxExxY protein